MDWYVKQKKIPTWNIERLGWSLITQDGKGNNPEVTKPHIKAMNGDKPLFGPALPSPQSNGEPVIDPPLLPTEQVRIQRCSDQGFCWSWIGWFAPVDFLVTPVEFLDLLRNE